MKTQHADKCASKIKYRYFGDRRNAPDGNEMEDCDCDGYHTFDELYEHRITLFIAMCRFVVIHHAFTNVGNRVWRSKLHHDGTSYDGWFILGIGKKKGEQISYHLPLSRWDETSFAETLANAPEWDGHTSDDVLERLKNL